MNIRKLTPKKFNDIDTWLRLTCPLKGSRLFNSDDGLSRDDGVPAVALPYGLFVVEDVKLFFVVTDAQGAKKPEAVFLVMCDPSMNEL